MMKNRNEILKINDSKQSGFTLIEFMIAITLSLIIMAALSALLVSSTRARDELQRANEQIENGRFATQLLSDDLRLAGYYGEFDIQLAQNLVLPADKPNPCLTALASIEDAFPVYIQGNDNTINYLTGVPISCISDYRANTDVLVIRRVNACASGAANCNNLAGAPYFQASLCSNGTELQSTDYKNWYRLDTVAANLDRNIRDCTTDAPARRLLTHIYFVAKNNEPGDEIPTLKRAELGAGAFSITPLVEGIENLQIEYGIDSANNDGVPEAYTSSPDTFGGCAAATCRLTNWRNVTTVKINLLARTTAFSPNHTDDKTYSLGLDVNNDPNNVGPFNDSFKRHVFQALVRLNNPAERRQ